MTRSMIRILLCVGLFIAVSIAVGLASFTTPFQHAKTELLWRHRWRSKLPRFILDGNHPWLADTLHKAQIMSQPDPVAALCSLSSPLRPNITALSAGLDREYPLDFYAGISISSDWEGAQAMIGEVLACPAALVDVSKFETNIWTYQGEQGRPPPELPSLFMQAMSQMSNLEELSWNTRGRANKEFRSALLESGLQLPSVRTLTPAQYSEWWVDACPGVERLLSGSSIRTADYWRDKYKNSNACSLFVESTRKLDNLTAFSMRGEWELRHLQTLLDTSPHLTELSVLGDLEKSRSYDATDAPALRDGLEILKHFSKIKSLTLPSSSELGLGFDGGAGCGNAYFGRAGREYGRHVAQQSAETTEEAAHIVMSALPDLKHLNIGGYNAGIIREEESGNVTMEWPWTRNMTEWLYEIWPEKDDHFEL